LSAVLAATQAMTGSIIAYAIMERARAELKSPMEIITGRPPIAALAAQRFQPWMKTLSVSSLTRLREGANFDLNAYRTDLAKALKVDP
jgi:hypothetical protein